MGENSTLQIVIKFALHIGGQAFGTGVVVERGEKGLSVFRDHFVEHCAARITGFVGGNSWRHQSTLRTGSRLWVGEEVSAMILHICTVFKKILQ